MLKRMIKKSLAIMIIVSMIFTSHAFVVFAEGVNANNEETVNETTEESVEEKTYEETEEESVGANSVSPEEETSEEKKEDETETSIENSEASDSEDEVSPDLDEEEETKATDYAEEPEDDQEKVESEENIKETTAEESVEEETYEESAEEETYEESVEETNETAEETTETVGETTSFPEGETSETEEEAPLDLGTPEEKVVNDQITGLYSNLKFTYERFKTGSKKIFFMFNSKLWEIADDYSDPDAMWQLDTTSSTATSQSLYVLTYVCNYEKFADGTYSIDDFEFPTVVSVGYGYDENGECWAENDVTQKPAYAPIMEKGAVTYNYFDDFDFSTISDEDKEKHGDTLREWFKNRCLDDYYGDNTFRSAPGGGAGNITLVIGNGLTSMNSEAAYYIPLYLDAEARNERFNRIVEDLKSRFGDDVYIRGLAGGTGKAKTFSTSTVVQDATQVAYLFPDEYESRILNATSSSKYFLVFGYYSVDSQKTWRIVIDDRFGHFTNETGLDEDGYFTYTINSNPSDVVVPEMELINGVTFDNGFDGVGFTDSVSATQDQLYAKFLMWLKSKGSTFTSKTYTADFVQTNFWINFNNASHLTKSGATHYWLAEMFDIVPPTIQKYNGSHYTFDKWTDADGNEVDFAEFVAAYQANPAQDATIYAREKAIEEKIIFDMSDFTEDMGIYTGDTEFYLDDTNWAPPTINCTDDYAFVGWSKEKYATALVTLEEITAEIEEWKENPSGNKTYYPVFKGKPMLRYTLDTTKGTVTDMPYGKMSFKYDEMTSLDLFQARPEIMGNFGYNFIGWNINSQYVELDDVANIIDTWAFDPQDDLVIEAAFESVGTLTLNIDTTKIEIADDPTGIQEANQIKLDGKTYSWPGITFNTIDDDIIFLGFGTGDELIIPIDEIADYYPGIMSHREDLVYDTIYRNKSRFIFNTTGIDGKGSISGTLSFKEDEVSSIVEPTIAENDDYEFLGWTKDTSNNTIISVNDAKNEWNLTSDYNLYPVFKTLYDVIYEVRTEDTNKATVDFTGLPHIYRMPKRVSTNTAAVTNIVNAKPDTAITRNKGYKFTGWSVNNEALTADSLTDAIANATSDIYIYANFEDLKLFRINIATDKVKLTSDASATYLEYDSEEDIATGLTFTNVASSGKKFIGFGSGNTVYVAPSDLVDAFNNWKNSGATINVSYDTILRDLNTFNVEVDTTYLNVSGSQVTTEDANANTQVITLPTITAKLGYKFNNEYSLTSGGTALTADELNALITAWDGESNVTLYALHEDDPDANRVIINIDKNKGQHANVPGGSLTIFEVAEFNNLKALITSITAKTNYEFKNWTAGGNDYAELAEIDWDGTSNLTIEAVFKQLTKPGGNNGGIPCGGGKNSGGSSGFGGIGRGNEVSKEGFGPGNIGAGGQGNGEKDGGGSTSLIYIVPLHHEEIPVKVTNVPISAKNQLIISEADKNIKNYAWKNEGGYNKLYNVVTQEYFTNGWVYAENGGEYNWYHFDEFGNMSTGWVQDGQFIYYLNASAEGKLGAMVIGTKMIDGKMNIFADNGFLLSQY